MCRSVTEDAVRRRGRRRDRIETKWSIWDTDYLRDSLRSHLLGARAYGDADKAHTGMSARQDNTGRRTPLVRALAPDGVSGLESRKPLGLNP
ncbi:hypothetical protein GAN17_12810 [Mycobacterium kubicae]|nr:hypothetical protein GAN17_12810 [Mycobacterium kubicae]